MSFNKPENIIVHHTLVSYDENANQFNAVDTYHKSKGWDGIGYHFLIEKDGVIKLGRAIHVVGAHCREKNMNYKSIGICLTGNFDIELPTKEQGNSLRKLLKQLMKDYNISEKNIYPHRHFAPKSCYGSLLSDNWPKDLLKGSDFKKLNDAKLIRNTKTGEIGWFYSDMLQVPKDNERRLLMLLNYLIRKEGVQITDETWENLQKKSY